MNDDAGMHRPIRVGISSCLLGEAVRFDGGHKRDAFLTGTFGAFVEWVPVCPEVECGFGTPRESMRLVRVEQRRAAAHGQDRRRSDRPNGGVRATAGRRSSRPRSCAATCSRRIRRAAAWSASRSTARDGVPARSGRGLFAAGLVERFPRLPVEEEGRLSDPRLRENFVERVFAVLAASRPVQRPLEPGRARALSHRAQADSDGAFTRGLPAARASRGAARGALPRRPRAPLHRGVHGRADGDRHARPAHQRAPAHGRATSRNVSIAESKAELAAAIDDYRRGLVPLIVPITLLRHYVRVTTCRTWPGSSIWSRTRRS